MTALTDLNGLNVLLAKDMERERLAFTRRVTAAIMHVARQHETMTPLALMQISNALDPIFAEWYGRYNGDTTARFDRLIVESTARCWSLQATREREDVLDQTADSPAARAIATS